MLDLRELSQQDAREFLFVALPLRIKGGTGSPINPIALVA
jgi:kynurenine formamidase